MPRHIPASWFACDGLRFVDPTKLDDEMLEVYRKIVEGNMERDVLLSMVRASMEPQEPLIMPAVLKPLDATGAPEERRTLTELEHARLIEMEESHEVRLMWQNITHENTNWKSPRER